MDPFCLRSLDYQNPELLFSWGVRRLRSSRFHSIHSTPTLAFFVAFCVAFSVAFCCSRLVLLLWLLWLLWHSDAFKDLRTRRSGQIALRAHAPDTGTQLQMHSHSMVIASDFSMFQYVCVIIIHYISLCFVVFHCGSWTWIYDGLHRFQWFHALFKICVAIGFTVAEAGAVGPANLTVSQHVTCQILSDT